MTCKGDPSTKSEISGTVASEACLPFKGKSKGDDAASWEYVPVDLRKRLKQPAKAARAGGIPMIHELRNSSNVLKWCGPLLRGAGCTLVGIPEIQAKRSARTEEGGAALNPASLSWDAASGQMQSKGGCGDSGREDMAWRHFCSTGPSRKH